MSGNKALTVRLLAVLALAGCAGTADGDDVTVDARAAKKGDLQVVVALDQVAYAAGEAVVARVTITNTGHGSVKLLSWTLPQADLEEPLFRVAVDGHDADYTGPHYKRPVAGDKDFVQLAAGASITRSVDLGAFYDLGKTGDYALRVDSPATSNTVSAWIEGRKPAAKPSDPITQGPGNLGYTNCTVSQQTFVADAKVVSGQYSDAARDYLAATPPGATPRYTTWFGAFSAAGWDKAHDDFVSIADAFAHAPQVVVDCGCKKTYYAYVFPNQPYKIYVCKAFWTAPTSGTDSKAGTLIHEMSHFNVTAATDDVAYGKTACMALATSNPDGALNNADSHEYFAENTPAQN